MVPPMIGSWRRTTQLHGTTSKTSRQVGQRWTDRAAGRRSAERHFVAVFYYYYYS
jgi:hypothetical protein